MSTTLADKDIAQVHPEEGNLQGFIAQEPQTLEKSSALVLQAAVALSKAFDIQDLTERIQLIRQKMTPKSLIFDI